MRLKLVPKFTRLKILKLFRRNRGLEMFTTSSKIAWKKTYGKTLTDNIARSCSMLCFHLVIMLMYHKITIIHLLTHNSMLILEIRKNMRA